MRAHVCEELTWQEEKEKGIIRPYINFQSYLQLFSAYNVPPLFLPSKRRAGKRYLMKLTNTGKEKSYLQHFITNTATVHRESGCTSSLLGWHPISSGGARHPEKASASEPPPPSCLFQPGGRKTQQDFPEARACLCPEEVSVPQKLCLTFEVTHTVRLGAAVGIRIAPPDPANSSVLTKVSSLVCPVCNSGPV